MKIIKLSFRNDMDVTANAITKIVTEYIRNKHKYGKFKVPTDYEYNLALDPKKQQKTKDFSPRDQVKRINEGVVKLQPVQCEFGILTVLVKIDVVKADVDVPKFTCGADFGYSGALNNSTGYIEQLNKPSIQVDLNISTDFSQSDYNNLYIQMINAIRHELAHADQFIDNKVTPPKYNIQKIKNPAKLIEQFKEVIAYLSDELEREPFIRGFMLQCKKTGSDFVQTLSNYIETQLGVNNAEYKKDLIGLFDYGMGEKKLEEIKNKLISLCVDRAENIFPNILKNKA